MAGPQRGVPGVEGCKHLAAAMCFVRSCGRMCIVLEGVVPCGTVLLRARVRAALSFGAPSVLQRHSHCNRGDKRWEWLPVCCIFWRWSRPTFLDKE